MPATTPETENAQTPISWGALLLACALAVGITLYPRPLIGEGGHVDHGMLMLFMWSMTAGLVRGVGFVPRLRLLRWLFSAPAAYASCALGCIWLLTAS